MTISSSLTESPLTRARQKILWLSRDSRDPVDLSDMLRVKEMKGIKVLPDEDEWGQNWYEAIHGHSHQEYYKNASHRMVPLFDFDDTVGVSKFS